ncbi:MAG: hypothetical protein QMC94_05960 [Anaerosomatales bacterium]|nr:hypothetical protein [Anaerosomatales bacterium]
MEAFVESVTVEPTTERTSRAGDVLVPFAYTVYAACRTSEGHRVDVSVSVQVHGGPRIVGVRMRADDVYKGLPPSVACLVSRHLKQIVLIGLHILGKTASAPSAAAVLAAASGEERERLEAILAAKAFLEASGTPAAAAEQALGVSRQTAHRRLRKARAMGLLPPAKTRDPELLEAARERVAKALEEAGLAERLQKRRERLLVPDGEGGLSPTRFAVDPRRADIYRRLYLAGMFDEAQEYLRHLEETAGEDYPTDEDLRFEEIADRTRGALFGDALKGYLDGIAQRRAEEQDRTEGGGDDA